MNAPGRVLPLDKPVAVPARWQERAIVAYPLLLLLAAALVIRPPLGPTVLHDSLAIYWVWADQFTAELARGTLYPRWLTASDAGLGTSVFYFYPPLAFYLTGLFGLAGLSTYASLIATFGSAFAASGIACWHWLKGRSNHPLLAAAFFMAAPYHLLNYTDRGALAESLATAFIPLIAIGLRRIAERRGGLLCTALAYAAMIGTHLPLALLVGIFLIVPYALLHRKRIVEFAAAIVAGIGLAAIYLVPALMLGRYHDLAQLYRTPNLRTDYWSVFSGNWSDVTFGMVFVMVAAIAAAAALPALRQRDRWAVHAIAVAVVVTGLIPFVWSLPLLRDVQFPFRALPIAEFALATALARMPRDPGLGVGTAALPLLVSLIVLPGFHTASKDLQRLQAVHPDVYEYLPKGVMKPGQTSAELSDVLAPRVPPPHVAGMIVEPVFYFPAWTCGVPEPRTQLLMHRPDCRPRLAWTFAERIGASISFSMALALLLFSCAVGWRRRKFSRPAART
ncbi:hypothetical protein [Sphingomonas sp. URHD0057]|uniref:hypothetical protein n=1 Tax=Sphingomonas sp. URHD0057 TaxID=1380389 RepID=UPI00068683B0|nr:hypothetical protein [Sphingomonas sp. URHD0057]